MTPLMTTMMMMIYLWTYFKSYPFIGKASIYISNIYRYVVYFVMCFLDSLVTRSVVSLFILPCIFLLELRCFNFR